MPANHSVAFRDSLENPSTDLYQALTGLASPVADSGVSVTPWSALRGTVAVYACVRVVAEGLASSPLLTYRVDGGSRQRLDSPNPVARLLHDAPNPELTPIEYWETVVGHQMLWGNHYSYVERLGDGTPVGLWPLRPDAMVPVLVTADGRMIQDAKGAEGLAGVRRGYLYTMPNGSQIGLLRKDVFHARAFSVDGWVGLSPIAVARNAIGSEQAAGKYAAKFYANSAVPSGALVTANNLKPETKKALAADWNALYGGLSSAHRTAILEGGIDWRSIGMPLKDAQFVETRMYEVREIARLFRVSPHKIGDLERATFSNIEHLAIEHVTDTLLPWAKRTESALMRDLGDVERKRTLRDDGLLIEWQLAGMLRGDTQTRYASYATALQNGWMSVNDVRRLENLEPIEGGDAYLRPLNMAPVSQAQPPA